MGRVGQEGRETARVGGQAFQTDCYQVVCVHILPVAFDPVVELEAMTVWRVGR